MLKIKNLLMSIFISVSFCSVGHAAYNWNYECNYNEDTNEDFGCHYYLDNSWNVLIYTDYMYFEYHDEESAPHVVICPPPVESANFDEYVNYLVEKWGVDYDNEDEFSIITDGGVVHWDNRVFMCDTDQGIWISYGEGENPEYRCADAPLWTPINSVDGLYCYNGNQSGYLQHWTYDDKYVKNGYVSGGYARAACVSDCVFEMSDMYCTAGYYWAGGNICKMCPENGQTSGYTNTGETECFLPANNEYNDGTGTYAYTKNCHWIE